LVVKVGYDPPNINVAEELVRKKKTDIETLRKQLKLPATEDPLAKDIEETKSQKAGVMKLIMEQSAQLKQMETEMEKIIKEKEQASRMSIVPLQAVPLTTIPNAYNYIFYNKHRECCRSVGKCNGEYVSPNKRNQKIACSSQSSTRPEGKLCNFPCSRAIESSKPDRSMEEINN